ncbi:sensor histidine kinase [Spirosoma aerophilum]
MKFFDRYQVWLHILGWVVLISLPFLTLPDSLWNRQDLISLGTAQLATSAFTIVCFYVNLHTLTPTLLREKSTQRFLFIVVGMLITVVCIRFGLYQIFPPAPMGVPPSGMRGSLMPPPDWQTGNGVRNSPSLGSHSPWPGALGSAFSLGFALIVSSLIALFRHHARTQESQQQILLEKVSAELVMLKLQVSPHFLFNTLNNIRWLARKKSDQTESAVVALAQLLRYMLHQAQQDWVPLRQEVQHMRDYIDLQRMRLTSSHAVIFDCDGNIDDYRIEPLLFIPFVENAFKYGIHSLTRSRNGDEALLPEYIKIKLSVVGNTLIFCTENPSREKLNTPGAGGDEDSSGIGISNVRKRLNLHYPGQHELLLTNENNIFRVVLTLHMPHDQAALHRH